MAATTATAAFDATARASDRLQPGLRSQKTVCAGPAENFELSSDDGRPAGGERPAALLEPWPQERDRRHTGSASSWCSTPWCRGWGTSWWTCRTSCLCQSSSSTLSSTTLTFQFVVVLGVGELFMEAFAETWLGWDKSGFARLWSTCAGLSTWRGASLSRVKREQFSMVRLMPDYRGIATASPGRDINTGHRAEAGATDPGADRGQSGRALRNSGG